MPAGPSTLSLNDDVKELRDDLHKLHVGLTEIKTEIRILVGIAKWGVGVIATTLLGGLVSGIWWAATLNTEVKNLGVQVAEVRQSQHAIEVHPKGHESKEQPPVVMPTRP